MSQMSSPHSLRLLLAALNPPIPPQLSLDYLFNVAASLEQDDIDSLPILRLAYPHLSDAHRERLRALASMSDTEREIYRAMYTLGAVSEDNPQSRDAIWKAAYPYSSIEKINTRSFTNLLKLGLIARKPHQYGFWLITESVTKFVTE